MQRQPLAVRAAVMVGVHVVAEAVRGDLTRFAAKLGKPSGRGMLNMQRRFLQRQSTHRYGSTADLIVCSDRFRSRAQSRLYREQP